MHNWENVLQSIYDTWLPLLGFVGACVILIIAVNIYKNKKAAKN